MTVAEYATHRGCSDSYVRRMRREQRLVMGEGKLIDVAASDAKLEAESIRCAAATAPRRPSMKYRSRPSCLPVPLA
jgi:hypothetical protein